MIYKVYIDMVLILDRLKEFSLEEFGGHKYEYAVLEIEATDPDDACYLSFKSLCDAVLSQDDSTETKLLLKELKYDFKVFKLE